MKDQKKDQMKDQNGWNIIDVYSRKEAIRDGVQVLANPETTKEAGFKIPVYMTRKVYDRYVKVPEGFETFQQEDARLWDVLYMLMHFIRRGNNREKSIVLFQVSVAMPDKGDWDSNERMAEPGCRTQRLVTLHSIIGANDIDDPTPCICITLPDED